MDIQIKMSKSLWSEIHLKIAAPRLVLEKSPDGKLTNRRGTCP